MPLTSEERFHALMEALTGTEKQLEDAEELYATIRTSVRRMRITLWVATVGLIADLVLSIALLTGLLNLSHVNHQVATNQNNVHTVECDLNSLFVQQDTPDNYAKAPSQRVYVQEFHTIYQSRIQLNCQPPMPEPQRPAPTS